MSVNINHRNLTRISDANGLAAVAAAVVTEGGVPPTRGRGPSFRTAELSVSTNVFMSASDRPVQQTTDTDTDTDTDTHTDTHTQTGRRM